MRLQFAISLLVLAFYSAAARDSQYEGGPKLPLAAAEAATLGAWQPEAAWPLIPIHAILLPNGKIFSFGTDNKGAQGAHMTYDVWDSGKGLGPEAHTTLPNKLNTDIFCSASVLLPATGEVLIPGGDQRTPEDQKNTGIKDTLIFQQESQELKATTQMSFGRWYPTLTTLPNGEALVFGGRDGTNTPVQVPEIYADGSWRSLIGAANPEIITFQETQWYYPRNYVAPDGRIFGMSGALMYYLTTDGDGSSEIVGKLPDKSRSTTSTAVMYQPGKILQVGGSANGDVKTRASAHAIEVDITGEKPVVNELDDMAFARHWGTATVLPTGEVLITGGSAMENKLEAPALVAEMWSPINKKFRQLAAGKTPRLYHSIALLLPDASVLVGGGGAPGPLNNLNVEIYNPPYLYDAKGQAAERLKIESLPAKAQYKTSSSVSYSGKAEVKRVTLVRTGAVTHSINMDQRFLELKFKLEDKKLILSMPESANIAPPGYYILFLIDANGVPSVGKIINLQAVPAEAKP